MPETDSAPTASKPKPRYWVLGVLALVALAVYGLDQLTKYLVVKNLAEGDLVPFLGTFIQLHFVKNAGAAFSIGTGMTWIFSVVAALVVVFIVVFARRIRSIGWTVLFGLLLGGTLGNLTDRLFREPSFGQGHVIDFIQLPVFPAIFNIADSAICVSMALFILLTLLGVGLDGHRTRRTAKPASTPAVDAAPTDAPR